MREAAARNAFLVSLITLCESIQVVIVAAVVLSFYPIILGDFLNSILPFFRDMVLPEREMPLFALFIGTNGLIYAAWLWVLRGRMETQEIFEDLKRLFLVQAAFVFVEAAAGFFIFTAGNPTMARVVLYAALGLCAAEHAWRAVRR